MDFGQIKNLIRGGREREIERGEGGLKKIQKIPILIVDIDKSTESFTSVFTIVLPKLGLF